MLAALVAIAAATTAQPPAPAAAPDEPNVVAAVEVRGSRPDQLLSVVVSGDVMIDSTVGSAPLGMTCGGADFEHDKSLRRQCWLRVRRGANVLLGATSKGTYGRDWTVEWVGCAPVANGSMCQLAMKDDSSVGAVFRRVAR